MLVDLNVPGILIDLSFDHYLTRYWTHYSQHSLLDFTDNTYRILSSQESHLSAGARVMLGRMRQYDILNRYHDWETVTVTAARIGERFRRGNPLLEVERQLAPVRDTLEQVFLEFYPQLLEFSDHQRTKLNSPGIARSNDTA